ncbi:glutathione S-transferase family protein [Maricurvus nonylphenolicus]|uniref:glutathione S-transferase family protein n=1 Tax=Maricurvus nonylphenolicus TaxID=1008307 RepID=UPI0036F37A06
MITIYGCAAPNPKKISIFMEEAGLEYEYVSMSVHELDQKKPEFLAINPNGRFPAIIDHDAEGGPLTVWESGAILTYLAEKTGKFLPKDGHGRYETLQWVYWQVSHAPYLGNAHYYRLFTPKPRRLEIKRFTNESARLYRLMNKHLEERQWFAAGEFTIADISIYTWVQYHEWQGQDLADFPNVEAWFKRMGERPGVQKGSNVPYPIFEYKPSPNRDTEAVKAAIKYRLSHPSWAIPADKEDQAIAGTSQKEYEKAKKRLQMLAKMPWLFDVLSMLSPRRKN